MDKTINTALVGFGMTAQVMHAPFLITQPQYNVTTVLERHQSNSQKLFPNATIVRSMDELLDRKEVELVIVTTPNQSHFSYAKQALEAGKHVVLEKPFTITSAEASVLVKLSKHSKGILSVFQNRRYVSDYMTVQEIVRQQMLGDIHEFEGHYDRYRPEAKPAAWREEDQPGSGILYDLGPHLIDQALCLFGLPKTITADIRLQRPHARVDDYFDLRLDYGFLKVILKAGMLVREPGPRYQLHGTKGSFIKWGDDVQEALLRQGALPNTPDWGQEPEEQYGQLHTEINGEVVRKKYPSHTGDFGLYYKHLYETLVNGAELREKPEHGYNTIKLIKMAFLSHEEKRTITCDGLMEAAYPQ
jgi:predicted dehydrogenase